MISKNKTAGDTPGFPDAEESVTQPGQIRLRVLVMVLGALGVLMAINQQFLLGMFGFQPLGNAYLYFLIGIFLATAFLSMPISAATEDRFLWLNLILAAAAIVSAGWLGLHGLEIIQKGWEYDAPLTADIMARDPAVSGAGRGAPRGRHDPAVHGAAVWHLPALRRPHARLSVGHPVHPDRRDPRACAGR